VNIIFKKKKKKICSLTIFKKKKKKLTYVLIDNYKFINSNKYFKINNFKNLIEEC